MTNTRSYSHHAKRYGQSAHHSGIGKAPGTPSLHSTFFEPKYVWQEPFLIICFTWRGIK